MNFYEQEKERREEQLHSLQDEATSVLKEALRDTKITRSQLRAVELVFKERDSYLDREYGKPTQKSEITGKDGAPLLYDLKQLHDNDLSRIVQEGEGGAGAEGAGTAASA